MTEEEIRENKAIYLASLEAVGPSKEFVAWLESTDFFTAPASTKYHGSEPGGLCAHSLAVAKRMSMADVKGGAFVALVHDVCKANFYKETTRNVKNDATGKWEKVPYYMIEDQLPMGHGEKSLYIVQKFYKLSDDEALAIRWHMGFGDTSSMSGYALSQAFEKCPLAVALHLADMAATYFDKK